MEKTEKTQILNFSDFLKEYRIKKSGPTEKKSIGWFCTYTPEEIIAASGFKPVRITGKFKANKAEGYFPINYCPYIKSSMEEIINESANLSGIIFTNSCDGMRRFYDVCRKYLKEIPVFMLDVPRIKNSLSVEQYRNNIFSAISFLEEIGGEKISESRLKYAIDQVIKKRFLLKKLNNYFKKYQKIIGVKNYFNIAGMAVTTGTEVFNEMLEKYLNTVVSEFINLSNGFGNEGSNIARILISGNFLDEKKLWDIFEDMDCIIAAEDMCNTTRYFENISSTDKYINDYIKSGYSGTEYGSVLTRLVSDIAVRQLFKPQCLRMADLDAKLEDIKSRIKKNKIDGVVFISQKFCDNTLLFYPLLRQELQKINKQSLFLEIEHNNISTGQIKTRIQAFLEII